MQQRNESAYLHVFHSTTQNRKMTPPPDNRSRVTHNEISVSAILKRHFPLNSRLCVNQENEKSQLIPNSLPGRKLQKTSSLIRA
jgi:hypothetical protein